jgi:hypothetical protein
MSGWVTDMAGLDEMFDMRGVELAVEGGGDGLPGGLAAGLAGMEAGADEGRDGVVEEDGEGLEVAVKSEDCDWGAG